MEIQRIWNKIRPVDIFSEIHDNVITFQIAKALGSTSIRHRSNAKASNRCLINVDPSVFAVWDESSFGIIFDWLIFPQGLIFRTFLLVGRGGSPAFRVEVVNQVHFPAISVKFSTGKDLKKSVLYVRKFHKVETAV